MKQLLAKKHAKFYIINAVKLAAQVGMGNRINTIMQAAFFKLADIIPYEKADEYMKAYAKKTYGKKGDAVVQKNWDGKILGSTSEPGLHLKAPWVSKVSYDTRNNLINFYGDADYHYDGGAANGPDVTINDKSGASADIDIQVVYSLDPSAAEQLYADYGTQTNYTQSYLSNDVRSVTREVSGKYDTITMLTDRSQFTKAVQEALANKWEADGLHVEQVSVQDVRYPETITSKYAEAQSAEIAKQQALNEQETAKVQAETKKIDAQGEADANAILDSSLTEKVLKQHYYDTLKYIGGKGNLVVVPEDSQPIINTTPATPAAE